MPNWLVLGKRQTLVAVPVLLALYAVVSWSAVRGKVATADEAGHLAGSIANTTRLDFRANREDPPLWRYWAGLPHLLNPPNLRTETREWFNMPEVPTYQFKWCIDVLYRTPGNDADALLAKSRAMMLVLAVGLGTLIAWWGWRVGGGVAAVVAAGLFALDPNFIAHGPLVKNDVACALAWLSIWFAVWRLGRRGLTVRSLFETAFVCGLASLVKFSVLAAFPLIAVLLLLRSALPVRWEVRSSGNEGPFKRMGMSAGVLVCIGLVGWGLLWTVYGFRARMSPGFHVAVNWPQVMTRAAYSDAVRRHPDAPLPLAPELLTDAAPGFTAQTIRDWAKLKLVPEAWANGLLYTYGTMYYRESYLLGGFSAKGWWYYFPIAIAVKTPIGTLAAFLAAGIFSLLFLSKHRRAMPPANERWMLIWDAACLLLPAGYYLASAMSANLNLGVRHVLPIYPLLFIAVGWAAALAVRHGGRIAAAVVIVLLGAVAVESASAFPNFIPFFNRFAGDDRARMHLLGDSNLDWGQDLKLLKRWRDEHPEGPLYAAYFGFVDPAYYCVEFVPLPGTSLQKDITALDDVHGPGYIALSATAMQGISLLPGERDLYASYRARKPDWILGRTIFIYKLSEN